jgi:TolB-like protein/Flp pilus assembly protein TadD
MIPSVLAHYEILSALGAGGMGEVYRARDTRLDREVALKILPGDFARDPQRRSRFEREAKAVAALNHPHIVTVYSIEEADGQRFLTMELVPGEPLSRRIPGDGMESEAALDLAVQLTDALSAVHERGITHRDLKPANVMVTPSGQVKVLDFGVAKVQGGAGAADTGSEEPTMTAAGVIVGTVAYMSPEQLQGQTADARSDIFSFGIVLYQMLTGSLPFKGENHAAMTSAILRDEPAPASRRRPDLPAAVDGVLARCLEKEPAKRYPSMAELQGDLEALRSGGAISQPEAPEPESPARTIAVLPFLDRSPGGEQEYFCDGITEEVINALVAVPGLKVAARTSSFGYKGADQDIREIGRALGVAQVLEGSVRTAGRRLRVTAQLINVADGYHVWSERYDRDLEDVFAVQDEISAAIVQALQMTMGDQARPAAARHSNNLEAYQLYLRGRHCWNRRAKGELPKAIDYFRQAIDTDPAYALAYSGLADCYNVMGFFGYDAPEPAFTRARAAAERALEIDPELAEAHCSLGYVLHHYDRDWPAMERAYRRAIELKPEYAVAHQWHSLPLAILGNPEEAKASVLRARERDPLSPVINAAVGWVHHFCGEHEAAYRELTTVAMQLVPEFAWLRITLGEVLMALGRLEEAEGHFRYAVESSRRALFPLGNLGHCLAALGRRDEAEQVLQELVERASGEYVSSIARRWRATSRWTRGSVRQACCLLTDCARGWGWPHEGPHDDGPHPRGVLRRPQPALRRGDPALRTALPGDAMGDPALHPGRSRAAARARPRHRQRQPEPGHPRPVSGGDHHRDRHLGRDAGAGAGAAARRTRAAPAPRFSRPRFRGRRLRSGRLQHLDPSPPGRRQAAAVRRAAPPAPCGRRADLQRPVSRRDRGELRQAHRALA